VNGEMSGTESVVFCRDVAALQVISHNALLFALLLNPSDNTSLLKQDQ
jgi:hypothetical protein